MGVILVILVWSKTGLEYFWVPYFHFCIVIQYLLWKLYLLGTVSSMIRHCYYPHQGHAVWLCPVQGLQLRGEWGSEIQPILCSSWCRTVLIQRWVHLHSSSHTGILWACKHPDFQGFFCARILWPNSWRTLQQNETETKQGLFLDFEGSDIISTLTAKSLYRSMWWYFALLVSPFVHKGGTLVVDHLTFSSKQSSKNRSLVTEVAP